MVFHAGTELKEGVPHTSGGACCASRPWATACARPSSAPTMWRGHPFRWRADAPRHWLPRHQEPMSQPFNTDSTVARVRYLVDLQARASSVRSPEAVEGAAARAPSPTRGTRRPGELLPGRRHHPHHRRRPRVRARGLWFFACAARSCRRRPRSTGPSWPARRSRPWACRWFSTRATLCSHRAHERAHDCAGTPARRPCAGLAAAWT